MTDIESKAERIDIASQVEAVLKRQPGGVSIYFSEGPENIAVSLWKGRPIKLKGGLEIRGEESLKGNLATLEKYLDLLSLRSSLDASEKERALKCFNWILGAKFWGTSSGPLHPKLWEKTARYGMSSMVSEYRIEAETRDVRLGDANRKAYESLKLAYKVLGNEGVCQLVGKMSGLSIYSLDKSLMQIAALCFDRRVVLDKGALESIGDIYSKWIKQSTSEDGTADKESFILVSGSVSKLLADQIKKAPHAKKINTP